MSGLTDSTGLSGASGSYGPLVITGGTVTTSTPVVDGTQTWNSAGVTFTGLKLNVTDTTSAAASLLVDLQVAAGSMFKVSKAGVMTIAGTKTFTKSTTNLTVSDTTDGFAYLMAYGVRDSNAGAGIGDFGLSEPTTTKGVRVTLTSDTFVAWRSSSAISGTMLTGLVSNTADILAQRRSTNAQTFQVYGTYTDASKYERAILKHTTGTGAVVAAETAGTGEDNLSVRLSPAGTGDVLSAAAATVLDGTAIPAGGTTGAGYKFSSTSNFGVFFGSGAPSLSAAKNSLYLRSDGSGVADRMYVNTNGSTTWTNVVTAA